MGCISLQPNLCRLLLLMCFISPASFLENVEKSSDLNKVHKDPISGELLKPESWSEERFLLYKLLRIRDLIDLKVNGVPLDPEALPEDDAFQMSLPSKSDSRVRRTVGSTPDTVVPSSKKDQSWNQQTFIYPKLQKLEEETILDSSPATILARFERFGEDILAFVVDDSSRGEVRLFNLSSPSMVEIKAKDEGSKLKIDFSKNVNARISDVVLLNPNTESSFICVTVDWKMNQSVVSDYTRMDPNLDESELNKNDLDVMQLNVAEALPDEGRSRMFRFKIDNAQSVYEASDMAKEGLIIPSIEAQDAETWMVRDQLYLAIAHKGNVSVESRFTQSLLYKVSNYKNDVDLLELYQGASVDSKLYAVDPKGVKHVRVHSRLFLIFASFSNPLSANLNSKSQVYRYDYATKKYQLWQELQTFGAVGVDYLNVIDPGNPLGSKHFIVFANQVEIGQGGQKNVVESIVYKYSKGKFLPFQTLKVESPLQVATIEDYVTEETDVNGIKRSALKQAIVFLQLDGKLKIFQFDGSRFKPSLVEKEGMKFFQTLNWSSGETVIAATFENNTKIFVPSFGDEGQGVSDRVNALQEYCSDEIIERNNYDTRALKKVYDNAPKKTDSHISVNMLIVGDGGSVNFTNQTNSIQIGDNISSQNDTNPQLIIMDEANDNVKTIDATYLNVIKNISDHFDVNMKRLDDLKKFVEEEAVKIDQINIIKSPVSLKKITTENLTATEMRVTKINTQAGDYELNMDNFFENLVYIDPSADVPERMQFGSRGYSFENQMIFQNISINGEFSFQKLGGKSLADYVNIESERTIIGKKIFLNGVKFGGNVDVKGTINGKKVTPSNILLKRGDQQITEKLAFENVVNINALKVETIENVDINRVLLTALSKENLFFPMDSTLTVDSLDFEGNIKGLKEIGLLDRTGKKISNSEIPLKYLVENTMKKSEPNNVFVKQNFTNLKVEGNAALVQSSWPANFFYIGSNQSVIDKQAEDWELEKCKLFFDEVTFVEEVNVTDSVTTYCEDGEECGKNSTVQVDESGFLDFLLTTEGPDGYTHEVAGHKSFTEVVLGEDSEVMDKVQGLDLKELEIIGKLKNMSEMRKSYFIDYLELPDITVSELVLSDGIVYQTPKGSTEEEESDLNNLFENGLGKNITEFPLNVKSINFVEGVFEENVDVDTLNGHDPEDAYIEKTGENIDILGKVLFENGVKFTENILQDPKAKVEVCKLDSTRKNCLCKVNECVNNNTICKLSGDECIMNPDVAAKETYLAEFVQKVSEYLSTIKKLALTVDTEQNLEGSNVVFEKGFNVNELKVTGDTCELNQIKCENIAVLNKPQTFTGSNTIPGTILAKKGITVIESIDVTGKVNNVSIDSIYDESLLRDSDELQVINGTTTIANEFTFGNLQTNNGLINNVNFTEVMQRLNENSILKLGESVTINTDVNFMDDVTINTLNPEGTVDNVNITDFLYNMWLNDEEQTISGNLVFEGNLAFGSTLLQAEGSSHGGTINNVDVEYLDQNAFRVSGNKGPETDIDEIVFRELASTEIIMESGAEFHGLDLSEDAVLQNENLGVVITGNKTFTEFEVNGQLDINGKAEVMGLTLEKNGTVDKLWEFLDSDESVKKLSLQNGTIFIPNEPEIEQINGYKITDLKNERWHQNLNTTVTSNIKIEAAKIRGFMNMETPVVNDIDLLDWRDNYLSISKPQNITGDYNFEAGVEFINNASVPEVSIQNELGEQDLVTEDGEAFKLKSSVVDKSLLKNQDYDHILANLSFSDVVSKKNLGGMETINNHYVLSRDFLTYKEGDEKIMKHKVNLVGNLSVNNGGFKLRDQMVWLEHEQNDKEDFSITGLEVGNGKIKFQPEMLARKTVNKNHVSVQISGNKTFTSNQEMVNLRFEGNLMNGVSIGTYENPAILLATKDQVLTDEMIMDGSDVTIDNLNIGCDPEGGDGKINGIVVSNSGKCEFNVPKISRTQDPVRITGLKSFEKSPDFGNIPPVVINSIFGVELEFLRGIEKPYISMNYPGDLAPPNITKAIEELGHIDSSKMSEAFLFMRNLNDEILNEDRIMIRTAHLHDMSQKKMLPQQFVVSLREEGENPAQMSISKLPLPGSQMKLERIYEKKFNSSVPKLATAEPRRWQKVLPVCSKEDDCVYVAMVNSKSIDDFTRDEQDLHTNNTLDGKVVDGYHLYSLSFENQTKMMVRQYKPAGTLKDIEHLNLVINGQSKSCVILCYDDLEQEIHCLNANGTFSIVPDVDGFSDLEKCYMATATGFSPSDNHMFALATKKNEWNGGVSLWWNIFGTVTKFQDIDCYWCSHVELGTLIDPLTQQTRQFLVTMSYRMDHTYIREFNNNLGDLGEFQFSQVLKVKLPLESHFTNPSGGLKLFILSGPVPRATITPMVFKGAEGFSLDTAVNSMELRGVQTMEAFVDFHTNTQYIATAGNKPYYQKKSANNVLEAVYKSTDIETVRDEFENSESILPKMSMPKCHEMVASYLMELHGREAGYQVASINLSGQDIGTIMLRVIPRHYIGYDFDSLPKTVRNYMSDERFAMFQLGSPSAVIANIYDETARQNRKPGTIRFPNQAYLGSLYVDQDVDGILYVHGILNLKSLTQGSHRHVSFWTSCNDSAIQIDVDSVHNPKEGWTNPQETSSSDGLTRDFCGMFHDADPALVGKLKNLPGNHFAGAIALHASNDSTSPRIGCGLMKNYTRARKEFLTDHNYKVIAFNPYKPGIVRSPIKIVELWDTKSDESLSIFTLISHSGVDGRPVYKTNLGTQSYHLYYQDVEAAWFIGTGWSEETFTDKGQGRHWRRKSAAYSPPPRDWERDAHWDKPDAHWIPANVEIRFKNLESDMVKHCDCSIAACNCAQNDTQDGDATQDGDDTQDDESSDVSSSDGSSSDGSSSVCASEKTTYCPLGNENTMCKYCGVDSANCGEQVIKREITDDSEKAAIVDKHNDLRRKVAKGEESQGTTGAQPSASNMNELVWDDDVAKMAQTWADQCSRHPHDPNRKMVDGSGGLYCGQNVYNSWTSAGPSSSKSLAKAVQSWYNEVKDFDNSAVGSFFNEGGGHTGVVGHYTQVIWADVSLIGCGYMYRVDASVNNWYRETVVCNYCKGGNYRSRAIYMTGDPASACPKDHPNVNDGLCKK